MGSSSAVTTLLLILLTAVPTVFAVTFQVGDTDGWTLGVDYTTWLTGKTFRVGDILEFKYGLSHSVSVVDKAGFDGCDESGSTQTFSDGDTKFALTEIGTIHFLCPTPGHCLGGMKLAVPVLAAAPTPSTPSPPSTPKSPPSSTPSPLSSPKTPPSSAKSPRSPPASTLSPPLSAPSPRKTNLPPTPSASVPGSESPLMPPSPPPNAASKGVMSYGVMGVTMVLMYTVL